VWTGTAGCARASGRGGLPPLAHPLHDGIQQGAHRGEVAVRRGPGGVDVRVPVDVLPAQPIARVASELAEERPLGAAVALPKGVEGVDLGQQRGEAVEECVAVAPAQVMHRGEAAEDVAAVSTIWCGRQNDAPAFTISTVRSCPAHG